MTERTDRPDIQKRTFAFAIRIVKLVRRLPRDVGGRTIARQLSRSGMSVGANVGEARGAQSRADFARRMKIARGEAMESAASLDVLKLRQLIQPSTYQHGIQLLESIVAMLTKML